MDNLADDCEDGSAISEQTEDRRADCEIHHRDYDLEKDTVGEEQRRVRMGVLSNTPVEWAFGT